MSRLVIPLVGLVLLNPCFLVANERERPPNIVFVLADDLGWSELGCYGNGFNETPNLDRLAGQGVRFTEAYAAAPVCSPYRAALLTGQHPARIGILDYLRPNSANALSTEHVTLPELLKDNGYSTGMVGKWHLSGYEYHDAEHEIRPIDHGFQSDFAREVKGVGNGANFWPYVFRDQGIRWLDIPKSRLGDDEYLVDRMNLEAVDFIQRNKDRPFFLYLSHYAPHTILNGKADLVDKYRRKHPPGKSTRTRCYLCQDQGHAGDALNHWAGDHNPHLAAMLESIDDGIGLIAGKLDELGLTENTILVFTSDNGGETNVTSNAPLRGGKSQLYEGGIRVPLIVRWPLRLRSGAVCKQPTVNLDFYPTLLEAAGIEPQPAYVLDGVSRLASWQDPTKSNKNDAFYWHYPLDRPHFLGGESAGAIRDGDWKLIEFFDTGKRELYSLTSDRSEKKDVAADQPEIVARLQRKLTSWRRQVEARVPSPPLLSETRQLYFADHFSAGQVSERWFFRKYWQVDQGVLRRNESPLDNDRIFLKDPQFKDVVVRFDFQFQGAENVRLVTGSSGHYNTIIHIHPDHFFIQTALDKSGPYFSHRHGECAVDFKQNRWYTMTVEFIGDQVVAHVDREHLAYAQHPIIQKERTYCAFQVDRPQAVFDNVQIFNAVKHPRQAANLEHIQTVSGKYPVQKHLSEQFSIQKSNAHDTFYQQDARYRALVLRVDAQKAKEKTLYPNVFRSHKEFQHEIKDLRKKLHAEDPKYKELLFATFRAERAIKEHLLQQDPEIAKLPQSRQQSELEKLRVQVQNTPKYLELVDARRQAQELLERTYPKLFTTNEEITEYRKAQRQAVQKTPEFKSLIDETAAAYRAQQNYLLTNDKKLAELQAALDNN